MVVPMDNNPGGTDHQFENFGLTPEDMKRTFKNAIIDIKEEDQYAIEINAPNQPFYHEEEDMFYELPSHQRGTVSKREERLKKLE